MEEAQADRKCRKKAKSFKRHVEGNDSAKELRRKLTYYLPIATRDAMKERIAELGLKKREFVIECLKTYFSERKLRLNMPLSVVSFKERSFQFDEIPNDLWLRVDEATRDRKYKRVLNHYHVVEAAIVLALGIQNDPLYKTPKEMREKQKRLQPPRKRGRPKKVQK